MNRYVKGQFNLLHKSTIGVDFLVKHIDIDDVRVTLQV